MFDLSQRNTRAREHLLPSHSSRQRTDRRKLSPPERLRILFSRAGLQASQILTIFYNGYFLKVSRSSNLSCK